MRKKKNRKFSKRDFKFLIPGLYVRILSLVLIFLGIAVFVIYISSLGIFEVDTIKTNINVDRDIVKEMNGKSIISVDIKAIYKKIRRRHPEVKEIYVRKMFPSTLAIEALKRKPFAQLKEDGFYVLDNEGVVLEKRSQIPYPGIFTIEFGSYNGPIRVGKTVNDKRLYSAYELIGELKKSGLMDRFKINTINATAFYNISFFMNDVNVIMGKGNFHKKLGLLKHLLDRKFNNKIDSMRYIDLRYVSSDDNIYIGNKR